MYMYLENKVGQELVSLIQGWEVQKSLYKTWLGNYAVFLNKTLHHCSASPHLQV